MQSALSPKAWSVGEHFAIYTGLFLILMGVGGLTANPDFAIGDEATATTWAGMDWNGWHALASIVSGLPALAVPWIRPFAVLFLGFTSVTNAGTGVWILFDDRPLGLFYIPTVGDALLHFALAAVTAVGVLLAVHRRAEHAVAT